MLAGCTDVARQPCCCFGGEEAGCGREVSNDSLLHSIRSLFRPLQEQRESLRDMCLSGQPLQNINYRQKKNEHGMSRGLKCTHRAKVNAIRQRATRNTTQQEAADAALYLEDRRIQAAMILIQHVTPQL